MVEFTSKVFVGHKQTALLVREVEGNPTPIISWSPCHRKNVCDKQYLNISKVQTARANYDCTARNALDVDSATTVLFIGGKNVFLRLSLSGECDHKDSVWKVLQKELSTIFTNYYTQNYSGADLIDVRCGSLIFDVVLRFSIEVLEHATISIIQNATVNEKLGELNVNVSYIIGIPPVKQTTTAALTTTTPNLDVPPMIKLPSKVFVGREQSASLNCEVKGNPTPTISWSPCDVENLLCDEQILNISKVQSARANYSCAARNYLGIATATTVLVIGGKDVYLRLSVSGECDCKDSLWKKLQEELVKIFAKTQRFLRAQLIEVSFLRCESLIFDAVLMFSTEVAEDDTISSIQNAIVDGKLGELSVNVSYIIGIPPVEQTTTAAPTSSTPKSDGLFQILVERDYSSSTAFGTSFGVGVLVAVIAVVVGVLIWRVHKGRNARKENSRGYYEMTPNERTEEYEIPPGRPDQAEDATESSISRPTYVNLQEVTLHSNVDSDPSHNEYAPLDLGTRSWEVAREDVIVEKIIGKGAFCQVAKGMAKNPLFGSGTGNVAIKMLKENAPESDKRDLKSELELMKTLKPHPHVIRLLGCVTESEPLLVLIEDVPYGDLLGYLRKSRGMNDTYYKDPDIKPQTSLTSQQLMKFAWQIADGMSYLSLRKVIHRHLAARNILVVEGETCKITDFGMARDVQEQNICERKTKGRLPLKWTAYEALLYGQYTTKSDVWSYGVVLYEIFTIGGSPFPRMDGRNVVSLLQQGYRMQKPEHLDNELYEVMRNCWQTEQETRPSFVDLTQQLKWMENQHKRLLNMHMYDDALYANLEDLDA